MSGTDKSIWSDSGIAQRLALHGYLVLAYDFRVTDLIQPLTNSFSA
jgi:hypothetical protein